MIEPSSIKRLLFVISQSLVEDADDGFRVVGQGDERRLTGAG